MVWSQFGKPERVGLSIDIARRITSERLADPSMLTEGEVQLLAAAVQCMPRWCGDGTAAPGAKSGAKALARR